MKLTGPIAYSFGSTSTLDNLSFRTKKSLRPYLCSIVQLVLVELLKMRYLVDGTL